MPIKRNKQQTRSANLILIHVCRDTRRMRESESDITTPFSNTHRRMAATRQARVDRSPANIGSKSKLWRYELNIEFGNPVGLNPIINIVNPVMASRKQLLCSTDSAQTVDGMLHGILDIRKQICRTLQNSLISKFERLLIDLCLQINSAKSKLYSTRATKRLASDQSVRIEEIGFHCLLNKKANHFKHCMNFILWGS